MVRTIPSLPLLLGGALLLPVPSLAAPPVPVSPGTATGASIRDACPTFSWSGTAGSDELELVVFPLTAEDEPAPTPALSVRLPAGARSWTPAEDQCLTSGGRYAWSLHGLDDGDGGWSEAAIFEVVAPSRTEVAAALDTLRRYLDGSPRSPAEGSAPTPEEASFEKGALAAAEHELTTTPSLPAVRVSTKPLSASTVEEMLPKAPAVPVMAIRAVEASTTGFSYGVYAQSDSPLGNGVIGRTTATDGQPIGVQGVSYGTLGTGVRGGALATTGLARGVAGETYSSEGVGVWGRASVTQGAAHGVVGESIAEDGIGVLGRVPRSSGFTYGVYGFTSSTQGYGVAGVVNATSGLTYGVYGSNVSPAGYGGFFAGRVHVTGALSKGSGSFKIDHPLDPANRYLSHSFVESPDMMNVYNGNVTLDEEGAAWVELPEWFEALNRDFRYQLTALDDAAPGLHVAERVTGNRFRIAGGKPGTAVSWQVTGIRRDAYAEANPVVVEEDKGELRGRYLHPEAHGQPVELAIGRVAPPPLEAAEATEDGSGPPVTGHRAAGKLADARRPLATGGEK